jgi:ATP-dependent DNA ligase
MVYGEFHALSTFLYAFDLIELNGDDLRRDPLEGRKDMLKSTTREQPAKKTDHWGNLR